MADAEYSEAHYLLRAAIVCGLVGGAAGMAMAVIPVPQYYRLVMLGWGLLAFLTAKLAGAAASFTGWILLLPLMLVPLTAAGTLAYSVGLPTAIGLLVLPTAVFIVGSCIMLKMES